MQVNIKDTVRNEFELKLLQYIFDDNSLDFDPKDYNVIKVENNLNLELDKRNSIIFLAPITTSFEFPVLTIYFDRADTDDIIKTINPQLYGFDEKDKLSNVLHQLNFNILNQVPITLNDFYDNHVAKNDDGSLFIELHAKPSSLFYTGSTAINITHKKHHSDRLMFDVKTE